MAYDDTNRGVLFKNEDKKSDKHPDYSGRLNVDGVEYFFDGWRKTSESGRQFLSVSVKRKQQKPAAEAPKSKAERAKAYQAGGDDFDAPF